MVCQTVLNNCVALHSRSSKQLLSRVEFIAYISVLITVLKYPEQVFGRLALKIYKQSSLLSVNRDSLF